MIEWFNYTVALYKCQFCWMFTHTDCCVRKNVGNSNSFIIWFCLLEWTHFFDDGIYKLNSAIIIPVLKTPRDLRREKIKWLNFCVWIDSATKYNFDVLLMLIFFLCVVSTKITFIQFLVIEISCCIYIIQTLYNVLFIYLFFAHRWCGGVSEDFLHLKGGWRTKKL